VEWHAMWVLGAYHGINPGMGWLFAVALGMQAGNARAVWRALPPIVLGHALAVAVILLAAALAERLIPIATMKIGVACCLATLGGYRLWRHRHPRFGGMRVGFRDLTLWSFLMASAHGAGFMLLPFVMATPAGVFASGDTHAAHMAVANVIPFLDVVPLMIHTVAYFATMAVTSQLVYRKLGLMLLRRAWINMDWMWAGALLITGIAGLLA
jgi:hypothetical protein